jgi:preprotein translocase subunit SecF
MTTPVVTSTGDASAEKGSVFHRLYTGNGAFDIVGKRKRYLLGFAALIVVCIIVMIVRGFTFSIEFVGGTQVQMPTTSTTKTITVDETKTAFEKTMGFAAESVQSVGTGTSQTIQVRTHTLSVPDQNKLQAGLFTALHPKANNGQSNSAVISVSAVSGSWGGEITRQAVYALLVFLVLVSIFLAVYFDKSMAIAALAALVNDLIVTAGVYSLVGFEVSPATVVGLLTILGFSLYDTVVVFDKVKENTRGLLSLTRRTYPEAANLALNQTLMRSINTSLISLLPVLGLLVVGVGVLGVGTLADLALVQLIGLMSGAISSIFLATPIAAALKMRDPRYVEQARKVTARRETAAKRLAGDDVEEEDQAVVLRKEEALSAAASVPTRHPKKAEQKPSGKRRK